MVRKQNSDIISGQSINCKNAVGRRCNSHVACYRVGKPIQKPVAKPVKVVLHAKKGNMSTLRKPMSLDDTGKQLWNAFFYNGRDVKGNSSRFFQTSCTLFCEVTFINSELHSFWTKSSASEKEPHAEVKALREITNLEENYVAVRKVDMLLSYSPCASCADAIIKFKRQRRTLQICLAFTAIFHDDEMKHCQGLQHLDSEQGIMLRVFTENDWVRLAKETSVNYCRNNSRKQQDDYWERRLEEILKKDVVLDMVVVDDGRNLSHPVFTSGSFRKYECFMGFAMLLVLILGVAALFFMLK